MKSGTERTHAALPAPIMTQHAPSLRRWLSSNLLLRSWRERSSRFRHPSAHLTACTSLRSNSCAGEATPSSWQVTTTDWRPAHGRLELRSSRS